MNIIFMGTPQFAVQSLESILKSKHNLVAIVTAPDKISGRGKKINQSDVKKFAIKNNIKLFQPSNLKSKLFVKEIQDLNPDIIVVVAFRMLPKQIWSIPERGTFNLHASLLPQYRGAAPINWAIINGEKKTGVTTFFIDEKIDTGDILFQEKIDVSETDTAGTLHDKLMILGSNLVVKTIDEIENNTAKPISQKQESELKDAPKIFTETTFINWNDSGENIVNKIRGLSPYPCSRSKLFNNEKDFVVKIQSAKFEKSNHSSNIGNIKIEDKSIKVAVTNGFVIIEEMQLPSKKSMKSKELLNGYKFDENAKFLI